MTRTGSMFEFHGRTIRWAERCLRRESKADQLMFGIVQGGMYEDLRRGVSDEMHRYAASTGLPWAAWGG